MFRACCEELIKVSCASSSVRRSAALACAGLLIAASAALQPAAARPAPDGFANIADKLLPSVVNISTTQTLKPEASRRRSGEKGDAERPGPNRPQFPP